MKSLFLNKGSIFVASQMPKLLQVMDQLPEGAEGVDLWISIAGGAMYLGVNFPKVARAIGRLFKNNSDK